jgi:hypothetical protein
LHLKYRLNVGGLKEMQQTKKRSKRREKNMARNTSFLMIQTDTVASNRLKVIQLKNVRLLELATIQGEEARLRKKLCTLHN